MFVIQLIIWRPIGQYFHIKVFPGIGTLFVSFRSEISHGSVDKHAHTCIDD